MKSTMCEMKSYTDGIDGRFDIKEEMVSLKTEQLKLLKMKYIQKM
jgi:hypothetical protein